MLQSINNLKDLYNYINKNEIQNIDIRFLDDDYILRSFTINSKVMTPHFFIENYFIFGKFKLLTLKLNRCFKDPFLPHPTLVFFTNSVEHLNKIHSLKEKNYDHPYKISFSLKDEPNFVKSYNYCYPPFDNNRNLRDEIILVASKVGITIFSSFYKEIEENILTFKFKNYLELLDSIEKLKYIILMVAFVYNVHIDQTKGIFKIPSLLKLY